MQVQARRQLTPKDTILLAALLLCALSIGYWIGGMGQAPAELASSAPGQALPALPEDRTEYDLPELRIELAPEDLASLQVARQDAIRAGKISDELKQYVPARIGAEGFEAKLRLKGDLIDHVRSPKWSMRIALKSDSFRGIRTFSIQAPGTRAFLWEWFAHQAARREGLLAPRSMFVSVTLQGIPRGIYFLEEHFTKDLLESQGRREGPIVKFDEDAYWAHHGRQEVGSSRIFEAVGPSFSARASAFDEDQLAQDPAQARALADSLARMDNLVQASLAAWERDNPPGTESVGSGARERQALWNARLSWVEDTVDLGQAAKMHALLSLLNGTHGLLQINLRFYFDPVAAKLEPIFYDAMPMLTAAAPVPIGFSRSLAKANPIVRCYQSAPSYRESFAIELARILAPGYLEQLLLELGPELSHLDEQLMAEGSLAPRFRPKSMRGKLIGSRASLRRSLYPSNALGSVSRHRVDPEGNGQLEIDLWPTTEVPIVAESFLFENGIEISALEAAEPGVASQGGGALLLGTGIRTRFSFDANSRLEGLGSVRTLLRDQATGEGGQLTQGLPLTLRWRFASESEVKQLKLSSRLEHDAWWAAGSRPASPSLTEALAQHDFLAWDPTSGTLRIKVGSWKVDGDLVIPEGLELIVQAGTTLRFEPGAVLLSHTALLFEGSQVQPIQLVAEDSVAGWAGLVVLDAKGASKWNHVWIRNTNFIERMGWKTTGGVTFYRSRLEMTGGGFEDAQGEDALNLFGTDAMLSDVRFSGSASDALDGDFVQLTVERCSFENIAADAIDTSGSQARIIDCDFAEIGDKCISAGENSQVDIRGGSIQNAAIGVASKDLSKVELAGLSLSGVRNYLLCAYQKKPIFGPAEITATALVLAGKNGPVLVQTGSRISIDGEQQENVDFDSKELYGDGILGN